MHDSTVHPSMALSQRPARPAPPGPRGYGAGTIAEINS